jgi:hypothetical protein
MSSLARFRKQKYYLLLEINALVRNNAGAVVANSEVVGLAPGLCATVAQSQGGQIGRIFAYVVVVYFGQFWSKLQK